MSTYGGQNCTWPRRSRRAPITAGHGAQGGRVILGRRCAPPLSYPPPHSACAAAWWCLPSAALRLRSDPERANILATPPRGPRTRADAIGAVEPPESPLAVRALSLSLNPRGSPIPRRRWIERRGPGLRVSICVARAFHARLGSEVWMGRRKF